MNNQELITLAESIAEQLSDEHLKASVKHVDGFSITLDVWYGLVNMEFGISSEYARRYEKAPYFLSNMKREMLFMLGERQKSLDPTGKVLQGMFMGVSSPSIRMTAVGPFPPDLRDPIVTDFYGRTQTFRLRAYKTKGNTPRTYRRTWACFDEERSVLYLTPWEDEERWGFSELVRDMGDMELVLLQNEARRVEDKESLNIILQELGRREKNRNAIFKPDSAAANSKL